MLIILNLELIFFSLLYLRNSLKIIDGALVGGASLDVDKFVTIINSVDL